MEMNEFLIEFVNESTNHINNIERVLLVLENDHDNKEAINDGFRSAHTVKGGAGFFDLTKIVELAHIMENLMSEIRDGNKTMSPDITDALLASNDILRQQLENLETHENIDYSAELAKLNELMGNDSAVATNNDVAVEVEKEQNDVIITNQELYDKYSMHFNENALMAAIGGKKTLFKYTFQVTNELIMTNIDALSGVADVIGFSKLDWEKGMLVFGTELDDFLLDNIFEHTPDELEAIEGFVLIEDTKKIIAEFDATRPSAAVVVEKEEVKIEVEAEMVEPGKEVKPTEPQTHAPVAKETVRIQVDILDEMMNIAGELVLNRNQLFNWINTEKAGDSKPKPIMSNIDLILSNLRGIILKTRMQPVNKIFNKFPRIIRELNKKLDKKVELIITGGESEMDKSIIDGIQDPLTHIIRNSMDHGFEMPADRVAAGKDETGKLEIKAFHHGNQVVVEISDDGAGIDPQMIKAKVLEKGLKTATELNELEDHELVELILLPGFSTASSLSDLSGRGVGMDVVKTNVEKLKGSIAITSIKGEGTKISLQMPLTVAIINGVVFDVAGHKIVLPQNVLTEVRKIDYDKFDEVIEELQGHKVLKIRDEIIPIVDMCKVLGVERSNEKGEVFAIVKADRFRYAISMDNILWTEEITLKPLPAQIKTEIYSAVTLLSDGMIAPILGVEGLANSVAIGEAEIAKENKKHKKQEEAVVKTDNYLRIHIGEGNGVFAIPFTDIEYVSAFKHTEMQNIAELEYLHIGDVSYEVIHTSKNIDLQFDIENLNPESGVFVILKTEDDRKMGIAVTGIGETIAIPREIELALPNNRKVSGLQGYYEDEGKIVTVLNCAEMVSTYDQKKAGAN